MNDIDQDLEQLQASLIADDSEKGVTVALRLLGGFLKDIRRIADAAQSQFKEG